MPQALGHSRDKDPILVEGRTGPRQFLLLVELMGLIHPSQIAGEAQPRKPKKDQPKQSLCLLGWSVMLWAGGCASAMCLYSA